MPWVGISLDSNPAPWFVDKKKVRRSFKKDLERVQAEKESFRLLAKHFLEAHDCGDEDFLAATLQDARNVFYVQEVGAA